MVENSFHLALFWKLISKCELLEGTQSRIKRKSIQEASRLWKELVRTTLACKKRAKGCSYTEWLTGPADSSPSWVPTLCCSACFVFLRGGTGHTWTLARTLRVEVPGTPYGLGRTGSKLASWRLPSLPEHLNKSCVQLRWKRAKPCKSSSVSCRSKKVFPLILCLCFHPFSSSLTQVVLTWLHHEGKDPQGKDWGDLGWKVSHCWERSCLPNTQKSVLSIIMDCLMWVLVIPQSWYQEELLLSLPQVWLQSFWVL